jgi:hypothetical protein
MTKGCTATELTTNKCVSFYLISDHDSELEIADDGTVIIKNRTTYAACEGYIYGVPAGSLSTNFRWEVRPAGGAARQIYSNVAQDATWLVVSCNRPLFANMLDLRGDTRRRYNFLYLSRTK